MKTAKIYEDVVTLLEEHGCTVQHVPNDCKVLETLSVKATNGNKLYLNFYNNSIHSAQLIDNERVIFRIAKIDRIQEWCSEIQFYNDNGYEIGFAAVESSD